MKLLSDILCKINIVKQYGDTNIGISGLCFDSRQVVNGYVFIATKGETTDGHNYISNAIEKGAVAIVCEHLPEKIFESVSYIQVDDSQKALGILACNFYDNPSHHIKLIGITGTNGKTTTATVLYELFTQLNFKCGLLSTIKNKINTTTLSATHTTPDAIQLNKLLNEMVLNGCEYCFMEVSSHAIVQKRIAGLRFTGGIFTNITQDHLDYHKTFNEYLKAKKMFFDQLHSFSFALTNHDDRHGKTMQQNTKAKKVSYALRSPADFKAKIIESHIDGTLMNIDGNELWTKFIGEFNAYNLLAVYSCACLLGCNKAQVLTTISNINPVEGRFEYIRSKNNITAIVDYAHTPDALQNVLNTIHQLRNYNEQLITVVGAGGNRDKTKRPIMGKIAAEMSDRLIFTSDNPRNERPEDIINDMLAGVEASNKRKTVVIINRKEAIHTACLMAKPGDLILVAGKGHENYQEINGVKHHFDDKEIIMQFFKELTTTN